MQATQLNQSHEAQVFHGSLLDSNAVDVLPRYNLLHAYLHARRYEYLHIAVTKQFEKGPNTQVEDSAKYAGKEKGVEEVTHAQKIDEKRARKLCTTER